MRTGGTERGVSGQVLVEILLILPIFLYLVFTIMEIGHLAFRTILLHHAAYEVARIGSLTDRSGICQGQSTPSLDYQKMREVASRILPSAIVRAEPRATLFDRQAECQNYDLLVELRQDVRMIFPMTGLVLGNVQSRRARRLSATVRMPIERPLFK